MAMSMITKLFTALRGGATEVGQAIVDSQSLRILDQEIRDSTNALNQAREELTKMMAQRKMSSDKIEPLKSKVAEYEGYAQQALAKNDEALAMEVATKISEIESELTELQTTVTTYDKSVEQVRKSIKESEKAVSRLKMQVDQVKATESVQRAQSVIAERHSGATQTITNAVDSLERIKQSQAEKSARMEAAAELANQEQDGDLKAKLQQAGIVQGANKVNDVLARLRSKAAN